MIKAIIFDLDGTIVDTPKLIMASFKHSIDVNTNETLTKDEITYVLGQTLDKAFERFARDDKHLNDMINSFRDYSIAHGKESNAYTNAKDVIQYLRDKNYLIGIVTSKSRAVVNENLRDLNLSNLFDCVVTYEDTVLHKPNKEPLIKALEILNVKPREAIYIGDHENDIKAGKNAEMKTALMAYSYRYEEATKENPNYIFNNFLEIKNVF